MAVVTDLNRIIPGSCGKPILADIFYTPTNEPKPVVIFAHGFKGFKDWGHFNIVARMFAEAGFFFIKFNFSHNGTTPDDPQNFTDLEAFGNNNYIKELDDLKAVTDWICEPINFPGERDAGRIYLLGHSRGGGICILRAAEDKRVKKLATWASVSHFMNRNKKKTIETWKRDGVVFAHNARTKQDMPMYIQFYESLLKNKKRLNILQAVRKLRIPFLIVHGTEDEAVKLVEAEQLQNSSMSATLHIIDGASHTFGVKHPFEEARLPADALEVTEATIDFFK